MNFLLNYVMKLAPPKVNFTSYPVFLIKTSDEGYSMFSPTPCDVLAEDWVIVEA